MSEDYFADRHNGSGTHHDRFLTGPEMLMIGVGLWRTAQWVKENGRRLTPQEKAQYDIDVARWQQYLLWEEQTPGAREAREDYVRQQEHEAAVYEQQAINDFNTRWAWKPFTAIACVIWCADRLTWATWGVNDAMGYGMPWWPIIWEALAGLLLNAVLWRTVGGICRWAKRTVHNSRVRVHAARDAEAAQRAVEPSNNLPVLWVPPQP